MLQEEKALIFPQKNRSIYLFRRYIVPIIPHILPLICVFAFFFVPLQSYYFMKTDYKYSILPDQSASEPRQRMVVLTGAGISAESGVSTFRSNNGLWQQYDWQRMASIEGWMTDPETMLEFYNMRRKELIDVQPNHAHQMLAELEKWYDIRIITQNIDNLHERAGSTDVMHLHGEITKVTSSIDRDRPDCIQLLPLDQAIRIGDKAADGSQMRPYVVWFGESVPQFEKAIPVVIEADILVVIGTSLQVYPAASLVQFARPEARIYIINPEAQTVSSLTMGRHIYYIQEKATIGIETLIDKLSTQK